MTIYISIFLGFLLTSFSFLILYKLRSKIGLAPLFILLGAIQYFQSNLGELFSVKILDDTILYPVSTILFSGLLFAILLIYIKEGVANARAVIIGVVLSNVVMSLMLQVAYAFQYANNQLSDVIATEVLINISIKHLFISTAVLIIELLMLVVIYQFLIEKFKKLPFLLLMFITLATVLIFDAVIFNLVYFGNPLVIESSLISEIASKSIIALLYVSILYFYLKYFDERKARFKFITSHNRGVFSILKFSKIHDFTNVKEEDAKQKITFEIESALNNISDGFVSLDNNWCFTYANVKTGEFLKENPEDLIGKQIWTVFPDNKALTFSKLYHKAVKTQQVQYVESYYEPLDRWFENRVYPSKEGLIIYFRDITEQKQAKENLINSELLFRELTSTAPVGIFRMDLDGTCSYVNKQWIEYAAMSFEDAMGFGWTNAIHPEDRERVLNEWMQVVPTGDDFNVDFRFLNADGKVLFISVKAVGTYNSNNKLYGYIGICLDITQAKEAKQKLTNSEILFKRLTSEAPSGIFQTDIDGSCNYVNDKWTQYAGLTYNEAMGYGWAEAIHPDDRERIEIEWQDYMSSERLELETEFRFLHKNNKVVWVSVKTVGIFDADNKLIGYIGMAIDTTERKEAEAELTRSELLFRGLAANAPVGIFKTDIEGACNFANEEWLKYSGLTFNESMGFGWSTAIHADDYDRVLQEWQKFVISKTKFNVDFRFVTKEGVITWMSVRAIGLYDSNKNLYGYIGMNLDITERKKAEEQLKENEKYLDNILNNIGDPIFVKDDQSRLILVNDAFCAVFGMTREAILGKNLTENIALMEAKTLLDMDREVIKTGVEIVHEETVSLNNKETRTFSIKKTRFVDSNNNRQIIGLLRDVTNTKKIDEQIRKSHQRLTAHINNSPLAIIEWNKDFIVTNWSKQAKNIFGWQESEAIGKHFHDLNLVFKDDIAMINIIYKELTKGELKNNRIINRNNTKENKVIYCEWYNSVLLSPNGETESFLSMVQDVTERVEIEKSIAENEEKFSKVFNSSLIGYSIIDSKHVRVDVNETMAKMLESTRKHLIGKTMEEAKIEVSDDFYFNQKKRLLNKLLKNGYLYNETVDRTLISGKKISLLTSVEAVEISGETHALFAVIDNTEKKITELELESYRNNLEELVELRTDEVNSKNVELERMNKLFVGRELKMRELKNIIKELNSKNEK